MLYRTDLERNIMNRKNQLLLMQSSAYLFYYKQLPVSNPTIPEFFAVTETNGTELSKYNDELPDLYSSTQMMGFQQTGWHRRGEKRS